MELLKWLIENFNVDGDYDLNGIITQIKSKFTEDDAVDIININILLDQIPAELWDAINNMRD